MNRKPLGNPGQLPISGWLRLPGRAACGEVPACPPRSLCPTRFSKSSTNFSSPHSRPVLVAPRSLWLLSPPPRCRKTSAQSASGHTSFRNHVHLLLSMPATISVAD